MSSATTFTAPSPRTDATTSSLLHLGLFEVAGDVLPRWSAR
jgi:hypothetical protein